MLSRQFGIDRVSLLHEDLIVAVDADGTPAHLRLAEREGFDPPCPFGLRFSRPTHLPILPPLQIVAREGVAPPSLGYGPCMLLLHHRAIEIGRN